MDFGFAPNRKPYIGLLKISESWKISESLKISEFVKKIKKGMKTLQTKNLRPAGAEKWKGIEETRAVRAISWKKVLSYLALFICPVITFYLFDAYTHNPLVSMNFKTQLLNIAFYELTALLLFGLLRTLRLALMLQSGLFMVVGLANYYVLDFRSAPIMPWDIYSISTAASVADNFSYSLGRDALLVLAGFLTLLIIESRMKLKAPGRLGVRALIVALPLFLLVGYKNLVQNDQFILSFGLYDKLFTPNVMTKRDGNVVAFMMELKYLEVDVPEGYSAEEAGAFYHANETDAYRQAVAEPESLKRPNIIVIMDEAFSDLSVLAELNTNEDVMPFIHSLQEDADNRTSEDDTKTRGTGGYHTTGWLNVSVLGGNTANTEFEFLTGHTMQFLPQGSVPYQQYLQSSEPSLASYLKDLGYHTIAMHPYNASGWERNRVYPLVGFEEFLSLKNFTGIKKIRQYVSDETCFNTIIRLFNRKKAGEPLFIFNVTMQNHSGYTEDYNNFTPDIIVEGTDSKVLSRYLSLMKRTDQAFQELVEYFSEVEEETIIVFFGDHQPTVSVSNPLLRANGIDPDSLQEEDNMLKYKVPFVIWSNFEIEERQGVETSPNYLAIDLLEDCGLPLPPYQNYLKQVREEFPVLSGMRITDWAGRTAIDSQMTKEEQEACREALLPYQSLQYYMLFDFPQEEGQQEEGQREGSNE